MNRYHIIAISLLATGSIHGAQKAPKPVQQLSLVKPFCSDPETIAVIRAAMDRIENRKLGYEDYSQRTGLLWSDVLVKTGEIADIVEEFPTKKATQVRGSLVAQSPQSIMDYPVLKSILSKEILPKMFQTVRTWTKLPEEVYAQIFFQRCSTSEPMDWHQDLGEDYDPQSDFSLVLMLSEQDDPEHGWHGGTFKIKPGLPESKCDDADVQEITPRYNQGIIFNNLLNSHSVTAVSPKRAQAQRDLIVIPINLTKLPLKKD